MTKITKENFKPPKSIIGILNVFYQLVNEKSVKKFAQLYMGDKFINCEFYHHEFNHYRCIFCIDILNAFFLKQKLDEQESLNIKHIRQLDEDEIIEQTFSNLLYLISIFSTNINIAIAHKMLKEFDYELLAKFYDVQKTSDGKMIFSKQTFINFHGFSSSSYDRFNKKINKKVIKK